MVNVDDTLRITFMSCEPNYIGHEGKVECIDSIGQLHGSRGGLALIPGEDEYVVINSDGK